VVEGLDMEKITRRTKKETVRNIRESILNPIEHSAKTKVEFLDSGSIVLNLVLSGKKKNGGWARGRVVNIVGDGSSGKTLLALEAAANCFYKLNKNPETFPPVKKIYIVYNNVEGVMDFPVEEMYGEKFFEAVEWIQIPTVQAFGRDYTRRVKSLKEGEFLLYIVDSLDAMSSEEELDNFLDAANKDTPEKGSYGMSKQKYSGKFFGNLCSIGQGKDSTLIIISQVRENINVMFGEKYRRSGGKSLDFYTHQCCWLAVKRKLEKTYKGETRLYGILVKAKLKRSKVSKAFREAEFVILFDYGVDDILSSIIYLYGEKEKNIVFEGEDFKNQEKLIEYITSHKLKDKLANMVEDKWMSVEENIKVKRERKFKCEDT